MAEVELGQTLHISDINLPKGVESVALSHGDDHDLPIAAVNKSKAKDEDEAPAADTDADADAGEAADDSAEDASEE